MSAPALTPHRLLVISHRGMTRTLRLASSGTLTIGRSSENDVWIDDSLVSRSHALLHLDPPIRVEDLGSQNGVSVHGRGGNTDIELSLTAPKSETALTPRAPVPVPRDGIILIGAAMLSIHDIDAEPNLASGPDGAGILIVDDHMRALHNRLARAAASQINVLLLGESGVGKEVFAQRLHRLSPRRTGPFLSLNCGAFTESLLESELFGYQRGAFTGANRAKPGLLEAASGGVVFLDEIGEMPIGLQVKLLRVLEQREVMRLGAVKPAAIDVRFVSATNRDLEHEIAQGRFRRDLFYRLQGLSIVIPPLRQRSAEILPLAESLLHRACVAEKRYPIPELSDTARRALSEHTWPGNIRELKNVIERAIVLCAGERIALEHLDLDAQPQPESPSQPAASGIASDPGPRLGLQVEQKAAPSAAPAPAPVAPADLPNDPEALRDRAKELEKQRILDALQECGGNQTRAAERLGMTRRMLIRRLDKYNIPRPRKGK